MDPSNEHLIDAIDATYRQVAGAQRRLFELIAEVDRREAWRDDGARDMAHWLWMRYGLSDWKARRWIASAQALGTLPDIADAFERGQLGVDKVVELTRFAEFDTEAGLLRWAQAVSSGAIRRKADLIARAAVQDVVDADRDRSLSWRYFDEGRRFGLEAELPAAHGTVVARALERLTESVPVMPGEDERLDVDARRADALVGLCSERIAADPDQDRATVVVHARLDDLAAGVGGSEVEGAPPIHRETLERLLCNARVQAVLEDDAGDVVRVGQLTREPPAWMIRQIRYRDQECRFPGCGARRFTQAHHIVFWRDGGRTDLDNLILICSFHHKLVHEYGWNLEQTADGGVDWLKPDGTRYRAGPAPRARPRAPDLLAG